MITVTMRSVLEMESMLMNYLAKLIGGNHLSLMELHFPGEPGCGAGGAIVSHIPVLGRQRSVECSILYALSPE